MAGMVRKTTPARKSLSSANLAVLGADRLADMLVAVAAGDANWKRRLKLELAAEVGAPDLALEIDKRLALLAGGKTRVSWRKRPDLIEDLQIHRRAIVDRLAPLDARLALDRLVAWFDLHAGLVLRVKDPKGELAELFFDAAGDLAVVASSVEPVVATPILFEALQTRLSDWGGWIGRAAPALSRPHAADLLAALTVNRARPTGRLALVVRKLADRAGDLQAWIESIPEEERRTPEIGALIATRLAEAGQAAEARAALETSRPRLPDPALWTRPGRPPPAPDVSDAWEEAGIVVLEAEGRADDAQAARWAAFERTLSAAQLKAFVARLPDFEDVEAIDRGLAVAAAWPDPMRALAFLMDWPALREAADMVVIRAEAINGAAEAVPLWAARLEARYPTAALVLVRARARALARQGSGFAEAVRALTAEAAVLAAAPGVSGLPTHAAFIDEIEALSAPQGRRFWR